MSSDFSGGQYAHLAYHQPHTDQFQSLRGGTIHIAEAPAVPSSAAAPLPADSSPRHPQDQKKVVRHGPVPALRAAAPPHPSAAPISPAQVDDSPAPPEQRRVDRPVAAPADRAAAPPSSHPTRARSADASQVVLNLDNYKVKLDNLESAIANKMLDAQYAAQEKPPDNYTKTQPGPRAPHGGLLHFGKLQMGSEFDTSEYCIIPGLDTDGICDPQKVETTNRIRGDMMRFVAEHVWGLRRPELLVSVTGGAADFSLTAENENELLTGLIAASKEMDVWFVSGGSDSGIMKYVGEARAKYAAHVPLIGIAPWGIVNGKTEFFKEENLVEPEKDRVDYKSLVKKERKLKENLGGKCAKELEYLDKEIQKSDLSKIQPSRPPGIVIQTGEASALDKEKTEVEKAMGRIQKHKDYDAERFDKIKSAVAAKTLDATNLPGQVNMNPNHSHFFFVDSGAGKSGFGSEISLRSQFETAVSNKYSSGSEFPKRMLQKFQKKLGVMKAKTNLAENPNPYPQLEDFAIALEVAEGEQDQEDADEGIPSVCICVQGGPGTIQTVREASKDTPVFLVKGSGNCADLVADLVILQAARESPLFVPFARMKTKMKTLRKHLLDYPPPSTEDETKEQDVFDYANVATRCMDPEYRSGIERVLKEYFPANIGKWDGKEAENFAKAIKAANSNMCWVYDLDDDSLSKLDFSGSLLRCVINGYEQNQKKDVAEKKKTENDVFRRQMQYCLNWKRPDILKHVLEQQSKLHSTTPEYKRSISDKVLPALLDDRVKALKHLVEYKATMDGYQLPYFKEQVAEEEGSPMVAKWLDLLNYYRDHKARNTRAGSAEKEASDQKDEDFPPIAQLVFEKEKWKEVEDKLKQNFQQLEKWVADFEADVRDVLGDKCRYTMGRDGPLFDLLIWSVMMSRTELSEFLWSQCDKPIHSALTACILYRKLAEKSGLEPKLREKRKDGGALFEKYAIGVVKLACEENLLWAMDALEEQIEMWQGITAIDVAVEGECHDFMEECLSEALERRFRGDLDTYSQRLRVPAGFFGSFPGKEFVVVEGFLKVVLLILVLGGGLLAPFMVNWNVPPIAENVRFTSQRRKAPKGYPFDVTFSGIHDEKIKKARESIKKRQEQNKKEKGRALRSEASFRATPSSTDQTTQNKAAVPEDKVTSVVRRILTEPDKDLSRVEIETLWEQDPSWTYWYKLRLFWITPVVLFMANSIFQMTLTILFTWYLVNTRPSDDEIGGVEVVLLVYFIGYLFTEFFQFLFNGWSYFLEFWNQLDLVSSGCFIFGFIIRSYHPDIVGVLWRDSVRVEYLWVWLYSITCCGLWCRLLRLLSIEKNMGILVITIQTMFVDILRFGIIWIFLWLGFSILMRGAVRDEGRWNYDLETCADLPPLNNTGRRATKTPDAEGGEDSGLREGTECWPSWWLLRLFFQSMGEFYNDEIETDAEMMTLMAMFVVMNILLLNLLIAIMSSSFERIQNEANRKYLLEMYDLSKEVSRVGLAIPSPINVVYTIFEIVNFLMLEYKGQSELVYGLDSWIARLEAHFGRSRDTRAMFSTVVYNKNLEAKKKILSQNGEDDQNLRMYFKKIGLEDKKLLKWQRQEQERWEKLRDAFVERCRNEFMHEYHEDQGKEDEIRHLETKLLKALDQVEDRVLDELALRKQGDEGK